MPSAPETAAGAPGNGRAPPRWSSCFVTRTDTGVGKTLVAAALVRALAANGVRVSGMKPVAAGAQWQDGAWRNDDVEALVAAGNAGTPREDVCPYLLQDPMAPHIAALRAGVRLEKAIILDAFARLQAHADLVVVEGVGGFCVPLAPGFGTADLAQTLALPVVLVVGVRLGCLNHAALTVEAVLARGLRIAGWVANTVDPQMPEQDRNISALDGIVPAPCIGRIPWLDAADPAAVAGLLDVRVLAGSAQGSQ